MIVLLESMSTGITDSAEVGKTSTIKLTDCNGFGIKETGVVVEILED